MRKTLSLLAVAVLGLAATGASAASAAAPEPAKSYGGCVSKATGVLRILERNNLPKSSLGKCKTTERRITLPSVTGLAPAKLVFRRAAGTETCARVAAATTTTTWTFDCTVVPVAPSPSPSPSAPASPTS